MHWIVFDYGEVIARRATDFASLARIAGASASGEESVEEFEAAYWRHRDKFDRGMADLDYWQTVATEAGGEVDATRSAALTAADVELWNDLEPESLALIEELAAGGHRLALLSNAPVAHAAAFRRREWARPFEHIIVSAELGAAKPDAAVWEALLERLGAAGDEVLFLDDRPMNVEAARVAGIRAVVWTGAEDARRRIGEFLQ